MAKFDYSAPAELYPARNRRIKNNVKYRRFESASDAIRFAVEELPNALFLGTYLESGDERIGHADIRGLYDSADFPKRLVN